MDTDVITSLCARLSAAAPSTGNIRAFPPAKYTLEAPSKLAMSSLNAVESSRYSRLGHRHTVFLMHGWTMLGRFLFDSSRHVPRQACQPYRCRSTFDPRYGPLGHCGILTSWSDAVLARINRWAGGMALRPKSLVSMFTSILPRAIC